MTQAALFESVASCFHVALAPRRRAVASAPMRVSFAGGGTDLPPFLPGIGGRVIGTAIDLRTRAEVEPFDRGWVRLELSAVNRVLTRRRTDAPASDIAFRLLEAALADLGIEDGVRLRIETDVAPGAGLGGSGSASVAAIAALWASIVEAPFNVMPSPDDLTRDALRLERDRLRLACGSQDPTFAAFGGVLDLRFNDRGAVTREPVAVDPALFSQLSAGMLLIDTGRRRVSGEVLGRVMPRADLTAELVAAAEDVAQGFACGSLEQVLAGMRRNAAAKLRRDPNANRAAVALADHLEQQGAEVVRMCGAGGGGHILVWAPPERHMGIISSLDYAVRKPALGAPGVRLEVA